MVKPFGNPKPLTVAYIRDELRNNRYVGDLFEALTFLLGEYDTVWSKYRAIVKPTEYRVTTLHEPSFEHSSDVV